MNSLRIVCLVTCLLAGVLASPNQQSLRSRGNSIKNSLRPTDWLSPSKLESLPAINELNLQRLEGMSLEEGSDMVKKLFFLSQINDAFTPSFAPKPNNIPGYIVSADGQKKPFTLNTFATVAKQQPNFGDDQVTIFITGLPEDSQAVKKANTKLVRAYMQRYNYQSNPNNDKNNAKNHDYDYGSKSSSEETSNNGPIRSRGSLVVINLGSVVSSFERYATLDINQVGKEIGNALVQLTNEVDVPQEIIHIIGQGISAHVAGAAARQYTRLTGHKVRRITALDPARAFAKNSNQLSYLSRGDADFVDAIHTASESLGMKMPVGDVDFYPNGLSEYMSGADNVVEAAMRATRYYAESVRPGNERNFPAVEANSLEEYKQKNGYGRRAYMGISTKYDLTGNFILQVNTKSPFGRSAPAQKQTHYHALHQAWNSNGNKNDYNEY